MVDAVKQDSNATGLRIAEEESYKVLPVTPDWLPYEPNSYSDFGGELTLIARNPINASRQRKKGVITDLDASGGFNTDITQENIQSLLQGYFFASLRRKGEEIVTAVDVDTTNPDEYEVAATAGFLVNSIIKGSGFNNSANNAVNVVTAIVADTSVEVGDGQLVDETPPADAKITVVGYQFASATLDVDVSGDLPRLMRASGAVDFTTLGIIPGEFIFVGGDSASLRFVNAANNGFKRVRSVGTDYIEIDKSDLTMVAETGTGLTVQAYFGRVLKNENGTEVNFPILRRTYQLERTLGTPDLALPAEIQAEYLEGAVPSELTLNVGTADKWTADLAFIAGDHTQIDGPTSLKTGNRPTLQDAAAFNTTSDFSVIKLAQVVANNEAPDPLFAFAQSLTLTINNNLSPNKAIGVLGAFDVSAGTFEVGGSIEAYFANVAAVQAVRANADITLHAIAVKENAGIAIDVPLIALGNGRLNVEQDAPITLPLDTQAATAAKIDPSLDHTLMMVFFDYLPNLADA